MHFKTVLEGVLWALPDISVLSEMKKWEHEDLDQAWTGFWTPALPSKNLGQGCDLLEPLFSSRQWGVAGRMQWNGEHQAVGMAWHSMPSKAVSRICLMWKWGQGASFWVLRREGLWLSWWPWLCLQWLWVELHAWLGAWSVRWAW